MTTIRVAGEDIDHAPVKQWRAKRWDGGEWEHSTLCLHADGRYYILRDFDRTEKPSTAEWLSGEQANKWKWFAGIRD